ncbi:MAG: tetratricopeptide repeat protein [Acidobacteriaceae bacterium]
MLLGTCFALAVRAQGRQESGSSIEELIRAHDYTQALHAIESGLRESPADVRLLTLEGIVLSLQGSRPEALAAFDKALKLSPKNRAALRGEAEILYEAQDQRALPVLKQILSVDPKDQTANEMLAIVEVKQGDCRAANEHFLLSEPAPDSHPDSLKAYGYCLMQEKEPGAAVSVFERLAAIFPADSYPKYDLAVALLEARRNDEALKVLQPLLAANPSDPDILSLASEAYEAQGDTPKAVDLLRRAIVLNPAVPGYYVAFAAICLDHDSYDVGIDMINAGLAHIPDDPTLFLSRGLLYAQLAQFDKAEADFNHADQLDSKQSVSAYFNDLAEISKNNPEKALSDVRSQLKSHPDSASLHYLLAKLLRDQGGPTDEAIQAAREALKLKPNMVEARNLLAGIYIDSGKYDLATDQCRLALKDSPSDQTAMFHLIIALRHSGASAQNEVPGLVKQLSELKQSSRQLETERKTFKLVEQQSP